MPREEARALDDFQTLVTAINQRAEVIECLANGHFLLEHPLLGFAGTLRLLSQGEAKGSRAKARSPLENVLRKEAAR